MKKIQQLQIGGDLRPSIPDERDFQLGAVYEQPSISDVDLDNWDFYTPLEIKDQKYTQECTGHGVAAALEAHEGVTLNPSVQYAFIKDLAGDPTDSGADLRTAMKSGVKIGGVKKVDCDWGTDRYDGDFLADLNNYPPDLKDKAKPHKQLSYFDASQGKFDTFDNFRSWLWYFSHMPLPEGTNNEKPIIVTGCKWRENWTYAKDGIIPKNGGVVTGGHCVAILPAQKIINGEPYLKVQNSYGQIGDKGCFWFPREVINSDFTYGGYIFRDMPAEEVKQIIKSKTMAEEPSVKYQFNTTEGNKVFKSLLLSLSGFVVIKLIELLGQFDFGQFSSLVAALAPFLINTVRLWLQQSGAEVLAKKK